MNQRGSSSKSRMGERQGFFKFFIPDMCSQTMKIPSAFAADYMKGQRINKTTFIRDGEGNVWPMEISIKGRALYFEKGWVHFVEDNRINLGEFLVFEFRSDQGFDFKHLGISGCDKEKTGSFRFTVKQEDLELGEEEESEDDNEEEEEEENEDEDEDEDEDEENDTDEDDGEYEEVDNEEDNDKLKDNGKNIHEVENRERKSRRGSKKICTSRILRADIIAYEEEIFGSGVVPFPKNPYFVVKIRPEKRQELFIPLDVVRDHDLKVPPEIDIVDENGKRWGSKVKVWCSGRIALKKGWKKFRRWNHLKTDDKCLFEFVPDPNKNKRKLCLRVRIFRA